MAGNWMYDHHFPALFGELLPGYPWNANIKEVMDLCSHLARRFAYPLLLLEVNCQCECSINYLDPGKGLG